MKISGLKIGDEVVFKHRDLDGLYYQEVYLTGYITYIDYDNKYIYISILEGYSSVNLKINFNKIIAKYDENGIMMKFDNIVGKSILIDRSDWK